MGIDLGTQGARALIARSDGHVVGSGRAPLRSWRAAGRHEQRPSDWWAAVATASRQAFAAASTSGLRGVAICSTSGSITLTDGRGEALTPGLMYDDARATREADEVNDAGSEVWAAQGYRMQPSWALPKLLWLLRNAEGLRHTARLTHQADYVAGRLIGQPVATDTSHALKTGYDLAADAWPESVFEQLRVPADVLPQVVVPGTMLGEVGAAAAQETGIPAGTAVFAGMTDGCAGQLAVGAVRPGDFSSTLGTTLVVKGVSRTPIVDPEGTLYNHRLTPDRWLPGGASSTGAGALAKYFPERQLDSLSAQAQAYEPSSVVTYPLIGRGERFPFSASDAEAFTIGVPRDEADYFASVLQGIAYVERLCLDVFGALGAPIRTPLRLVGGAAQNRYWNQLRADVLRRVVLVPETTDSAMGMALLASTQDRSLESAAAAMVRTRDSLEPRDDAERFDGPYEELLEHLTERGWLTPSRVQRARGQVAS